MPRRNHSVRLRMGFRRWPTLRRRSSRSDQDCRGESKGELALPLIRMGKPDCAGVDPTRGDGAGTVVDDRDARARRVDHPRALLWHQSTGAWAFFSAARDSASSAHRPCIVGGHHPAHCWPRANSQIARRYGEPALAGPCPLRSLSLHPATRSTLRRIFASVFALSRVRGRLLVAMTVPEAA